MNRSQEILNVEQLAVLPAVQIAKDESGHILRLSGEIRINLADDLRAALLDLVSTASSPVIDLAGVTACDAALLQLLISANRTAERFAKPLKLVGLSAAVREAGTTLGLSLAEAPAGKSRLEDAL